MKQQITKNSAVLKLICLLAFLGITTANAQYTAIPDANFEQALFDLGIDTVNGDHQVLTSAISGVTSLDVSNKSISSLTGIQGFSSLQTLNCSSNQLQYINVSGLTFLSSLNCSSNQLYVNYFNVSYNTALTYLDCSSNQLTSIDVSANTALTYLNCGYNQLPIIDVSANTALTYLDCGSNQLTSLDVSAAPALTHLNCMSNQLTTLLALPNTLTYLDCSNNQISQFGYVLFQLTYLNCSHNQLTFIETNWFGVNLSYFNCSYNQLTNLHVVGLINLTHLICSNNQLTGLNVWGLNKLTSLFCEDNQISVFNNNWNGFLAPNLQYFTCFNNQLTSLDVSWLKKLVVLFCYNNQITSIDASNLPYLNQFWCWNNQLTALNVSGDSNLNQFWSYNNPNLSCIQVSDVAAAYSNYYWYEDSTVIYSLNCNLPSAPIANAQSFCTGATVANLVGTGTALKWYAAATGGIALVNTTILTTGTYYVSQTVGGVESTRTAVNITVNPLVTPTFTQIVPVCRGTTITPLPTTSTNGITGTWSPAVNNTATTTYTFTPTTGLCASTASMTIVILAAPEPATMALFVNQGNGCAPHTTQWNFTVPPANANGTTYTINWGDGSANETYAHPVAINTLTHIYNTSSCGTNVILNGITYYNVFKPTITTQNICSATSSIPALIAVGKGPTANFSSSLTIGSTNQSVQLSNTSDFGLTIPSTNWTSCTTTAPFYWTISPSNIGSYTTTGLGSNNGDSFDESNWTIGSMTPSIIFNVPGTYTIALRVKNSCGDSTVAKTICIEAPLVPQFTLNSTQGCSPAVISATNTTNLSYSCNPPTYLWDVTYAAGYCGSGTPTWNYTSGSATTANPSFNFVTPGIYNIRVTMTNSAGSVTPVIQTVIVKQPPVVLINSATPTTCQTANFTAVVNGCAPSTNPLTYSWSFPGGIPAASTLAAPSNISYSTTGLKTVTLVVTNECGTTTDSKTFTINPSALPTISGSLSACQSATSQLTGSAVASTINPWRSSNIGVATVNATGLVTAVAPGTITITYTTNNGCTATALFTVNPTATPTFAAVPSVCSGATIAALPTTSTNGITGTWSPALNTTTTTTYTFTPTAGQCANTTTQTITVSSPSITSDISFVAPPAAALPSVTIGTQIWTNKNLDVSTYRDGTLIPQVTDPTAWANLTTGAWCYYSNDPANVAVYGKLYNWYAVAGIHDNDPNTPNKILAPLGWHVASDAEWTTLTTFLGGEQVAGDKMKATGTLASGSGLWQSSNTAATNESGFTAIPAGYRDIDGVFYVIGLYSDWWSSSESNTLSAWYCYLTADSGRARRTDYNKKSGSAVRCIKN